MRHLTAPSVLILSLALVGCVSNDNITRLYLAPGHQGTEYSKVLVVGAHKNHDLRRRFEASVVRSLNDVGTAAVASTTALGADVDLNHESVVGAAEETQSSAVLVTRLLDADSRVAFQDGRVDIEAERRGDIPLLDFFRYDYVEYQDPMTIDTIYTVVLATDLYSAADESRIWGIESASVDKHSVEDVIDSAAVTIVRQLRRDGLISTQ